jgi:hypothetical protein
LAFTLGFEAIQREKQKFQQETNNELAPLKFDRKAVVGEMIRRVVALQ